MADCEQYINTTLVILTIFRLSQGQTLYLSLFHYMHFIQIGEIEQIIEPNNQIIAIKQEEEFSIKVEADGGIDDDRPLYKTTYLDNQKTKLGKPSAPREFAVTKTEVPSEKCVNCDLLKQLIEKLSDHARNIIDEKEKEITETLSLVVAESGKEEEMLKMRARLALLEKRHASPTKKQSDSEAKAIVPETDKNEEKLKMLAKIAVLEKRIAALSKINSDSEVENIVDRKKRKYKICVQS